MTKEFILKIELENAAFTNYPEQEISRILAVVRDRLETEGLKASKLLDINGNSVGGYGVYKS